VKRNTLEMEKLPEKDLAEWLNLPIKDSGACSLLAYWARNGLPCVELSGKRFFFEQDVIDFLWKRRVSKNSQRFDEKGKVSG
jgi:hypothetical protein